jgi:hypothetical protein
MQPVYIAASVRDLDWPGTEVKGHPTPPAGSNSFNSSLWGVPHATSIRDRAEPAGAFARPQPSPRPTPTRIDQRCPRSDEGAV